MEDRDGVMSLGRILDTDEVDLPVNGGTMSDGVGKDAEAEDEEEVEAPDGYCIECEGVVFSYDFHHA